MVDRMRSRQLLYGWVNKIRSFKNQEIGHQVRDALNVCPDPVPCFVICYNNAKHVESMVSQLNRLGITPLIFDNGSICTSTISLLRSIKPEQGSVIWVGRNLRHKVGFLPGIYEYMPKVFAYTDPDLQFNSRIPTGFIQTLTELTREYDVFKAGLALALEPLDLDRQLRFEKFSSGSIPFQASYSISEWETKFWRFKLQRQDDLEVYAAPLDTTFAVYNKSNYKGMFLDAVRLAGDFSVIHLPWYPNLDNMDPSDRANYLKGNKSSTWLPSG